MFKISMATCLHPVPSLKSPVGERLCALLLSLVFSTQLASAQTNESSPSPTQEELQARIHRMEAQIESLCAELAELKRLVAPQTKSGAASSPCAASLGLAANAQAESKAAASHRASERTQGIELGPFHATPYGAIYFNLFGNSGASNNADVPLFAAPTGSGGIGASVRQTRLGLRLTGPEMLHARSSGTVEADFFGGFPAIGIGENFSLVRLRLAFARLDWKRTALIMGQDWMVFAPANPTSIAAAAVPQMAAAGNPWARLPQIKVEHRSFDGVLLWQAALLAPSTGDYPSGTSAPFTLQPSTGSASRLPFFQGRIALSGQNWLGSKRTGNIGISVHYGRARVAKERINSDGLALDWSTPLSRDLTLSGEAFIGEDLAGFQSGIFQGFNPDAIVRREGMPPSTRAKAIGTRGGWVQLGWTLPALSERATLYASFGLDDPRDRDLRSASPRDWRTRNVGGAINLIYKISPQLSWGIEFRRLETNYLISGKQRVNHLNAATIFSF